MRPRESINADPQGDLFMVELAAIIDPDYPLVRLADQIDWAYFERELGAQFCDTNGAPAKPVRLMLIFYSAFSEPLQFQSLTKHKKA